jgi:hypothetical protein
MIKTTPAFFTIVPFRNHTGIRPKNTIIRDSAKTPSDPLLETAENFPDDEEANEKTIFPQPRRPRIPPARPCRTAGEYGF